MARRPLDMLNACREIFGSELKKPKACQKYVTYFSWINKCIKYLLRWPCYVKKSKLLKSMDWLLAFSRRMSVIISLRLFRFAPNDKDEQNITFFLKLINFLFLFLFFWIGLYTSTSEIYVIIIIIIMKAFIKRSYKKGITALYNNTITKTIN